MPQKSQAFLNRTTKRSTPMAMPPDVNTVAPETSMMDLEEMPTMDGRNPRLEPMQTPRKTTMGERP